MERPVSNYEIAKQRVQKEFVKYDISYKLPLFEADDEFPPQVTVFVDKLTLLYMHYETIWYAMGFVFQEIQKRMEKE